ncbi:hypothetical protein PMAYCL1PPCAC_22812 [Pristionchus mayeri]|uniref:Peptidase n=1 Tax=Pristionchus mayeri TaxID=1317129 RepID=A0AAN5I536_9BILA|nr:hypothetical protein PMAYCL1PPCAC_22812 [Pristionchus mayeri]
MLKILKYLFGIALILAVLGTLGLSIASLITVLNIQDTINSQFSTAPTAPTSAKPDISTVSTPAAINPSEDPTDAPNPSTAVNTIPVAKPISDNDPRYPAYQGMSELLSTWMNRSINPCDDFYEFTCGAGKEGQEMSFDLSDDSITESMLEQLRKPSASFNSYPLPVRQMKWFYDSCMTGATEVCAEFAARSVRIFNDLRNSNPGVGFPALYPKETTAATPEQLAAFLGYSVGTNGLTTLVDVGVDTDWKDPHNSKGGYALLVDQPATLFISTFYTKMYNDYADLVVDEIFNEINAAAQLLNIKNVDQKQVKKDAEEVAQLDFDLATKYSTDDSTRRQYARSYNPYSVEGLQKMAPFIDWKTFFDKVFVPVGTSVDGSFRSIAMEPEKLALLSADIASGAISSRAINNYLYLRALNQNYLPKVKAIHKNSVIDGFRREKRPINRKVRRVPKTEPQEMGEYTPKESNCQGLTTQFLTWANTRLFVDANYPTAKDKQNVREQTTSIVSSILVAFRAQIDLLDWMTPASKKGAYQKIDNLVVNIAFPDWVLDDAKLTDYYKKLTTKQADAYLNQIDQLNAFGLYEAFSPLVNGAPTDRTDFSGPAAITNAWYQPEVNSITFPGGILHAPFYDFNYPAAINYGGLGVIAGHELTHGFDDQGVQWEGTGILNSWMDDNSTKSFTDMAQCVVNEYSRFCPLGKGQPCVDGDQTQGENIADNGGIQAAYKAFKAYEALHGPDPLLPGFGSDFTADQLFFLGFAQVWCQYPPSDYSLLTQILVDPHSPSLYRVLGTVQNIPAFQKAFNCPIGSTYTPVKHCNVWTSEPTTGAPVNVKGEPIVPENDVNVAPAERISPQDMEKYSVYQNTLAIYKASANLTVDPCDDFYQYSCGAYPGPKNTFYDLEQANNKVIYDKLNDPDYQETIANSSALTMLQTLYTSCVAEAQQPSIATTNYLQPKVLKFRNMINQDIPLIGGTGAVHVTPEDYGNALGYLSFQLGIDTLVTPMVDTNWDDPQAAKPETTNGYQLFLDQASTYHVRAFYEDGNWEQKRDGYKAQVKSLVQAYAMQDETAQLPADYVDMIDKALEMERDIAITYSRTDEEGRNYARQWKPKMLNALPPDVDWDKFFSLAPKDAQVWIQTKNIVMNEFDYTSNMFTYLGNKGDDRALVNYLFIRLILDNSGLIPCANGMCVSVKRELAKKKVPEHTGKSRISHRRLPLPSRAALNDDDADGMGCAEEIGAMADAQARVYIDGRFPTEADRTRIRSSILGVMNNIVDSMKAMIDQLDWMTEDSKKKAANKASNIQVNPAFPDFILDRDQLDAKYTDLTFEDGDSYYDMLDKITIYTINQQFAYLTYPKADRTDFLGQTAVVNAWYDPELNSITFPAGILVQPYFDVNYPAGMNYGGVGIVAGHELTHGFDDEGVQWDFDGRLNSWMDADSQAGFNSMAQCVIDEYSQFCPLPEGFSPRCTDGVRTQGENIADNGGIHSSWRAYQAHLELDGPDPLFMDRVFSQYSENQLFFLNFAQLWCQSKSMMTESYISNQLMTNVHSMGPYRTLGTLQNIPAFQTNYNCQRGSTYAPVNHCSVWVPTKMA